MRRAIAIAVVCGVIFFAAVGASMAPKVDERLKGAFRRPAVNGWTFVHLEGTPGQIGYQHGYLLAAEIQDLYKVYALELTHDNGKDWNFFRDAAKNILWPHVEQEYRDEMQGIVEGVNAQGGKLDIWDIVTLNAAMEWSYYVDQYDKAHKIASLPTVTAGDHCSAFVAIGSYTKDGRVVIAHNNWTSYLDGARFHGFDSDGVPEFVRARKAMQYSASIDDVARIFKEGNNGGYANDWLIADTRKGEIASLELGLKNVTLERKTDGYFVGSNFPISPKLAAEETDFPVGDPGVSANARHRRWDQLMAENKGKIDVTLAEQFLADHVDSISGKTAPSERTLCGHVDLSPRGMGSWQSPFGTAGAVQNKATDTQMAARMEFTAAAGHACGMDFLAAKHLQQHPEQSWEKPELRDMKAYPWTTIAAQK